MHSFKRYLLTCILLAEACSTKGGGSSSPAPSATPPATKTGGCLDLVNGSATTAYPAVVRLLSKPDATHIGVCSGTFISPVAVITAAHCLDGTATGGLSIVGGTSVSFNDSNVDPFKGAVASLKAFTYGAYGETGDANDATVTAKDNAILLFPPNVATAYLSLGSAQPPVGSVVTSVGFGLTTLSDATADPNFDASKHAGSTKIITSLDQVNLYTGGVTAAASAAANGTSVIDSFGDSGGPMLFNNTLVATLSNGGAAAQTSGPEDWYITFVDANSANTKQLIALANQNGAAIPAAGATPTTLSASTTTAPTSASCPK